MLQGVTGRVISHEEVPRIQKICSSLFGGLHMMGRGERKAVSFLLKGNS